MPETLTGSAAFAEWVQSAPQDATRAAVRFNRVIMGATVAKSVGQERRFCVCLAGGANGSGALVYGVDQADPETCKVVMPRSGLSGLNRLQGCLMCPDCPNTAAQCLTGRPNLWRPLSV